MRYLPLFRPNRFGTPIAPLNIQWHASINNIGKTLKRYGWHTNLKNNPSKKNINTFAQKHLKYHIPLLPVLYQNHRPVLIASKLSKKSTILLYLWPTYIKLNNSKQHLWVGSIYQYQAHHPKIFNLKWLLKNYKKSHKIITIKEDILPKQFNAIQWDKRIVLIQ